MRLSMIAGLSNMLKILSFDRVDAPAIRGGQVTPQEQFSLRADRADGRHPKSVPPSSFGICVPDVEFFVVSDRLNIEIIGSRRAMYGGTKVGQTDAAHIGKWNLES